MKSSTVIVLLLLSGPVLAAPPDNSSSRTDNSGTVTVPVSGSYASYSSNVSNVSNVSNKSAATVSRKEERNQDASKQTPRAKGNRVSATFNSGVDAGYLSSTGELVEAGQACIFNQASYTYSCR